MFIYNHEKELLGVDESGLKALGLSSLEAFCSLRINLWDLFVKAPGYIHDLKHIDSIIKSGDKAKVLIRINNDYFSFTVDIQPFYLLQNPSQEAFLLSLSNKKLLLDQEKKHINTDLNIDSYAFEEPMQEQLAAQQETEVPSSIEIAELADDDFFHRQNSAYEGQTTDEELSILDHEDFSLDISLEEDVQNNDTKKDLFHNKKKNS